MLYILGIDHKLHQQNWPWSNEAVQDLKQEITEKISERAVGLLAEEMSDDGARVLGIERTVVQEIAEENAIKYIHVDPNIRERKELGIRTRQETAEKLGIDIFNATEKERDIINQNHKDADQMREQEWFRRIEPYLDNDVIVVCGFEHVLSFHALVQNKGYEVGHKILDH